MNLYLAKYCSEVTSFYVSFELPVRELTLPYLKSGRLCSATPDWFLHQVETFHTILGTLKCLYPNKTE